MIERTAAELIVAQTQGETAVAITDAFLAAIQKRGQSFVTNAAQSGMKPWQPVTVPHSIKPEENEQLFGSPGVRFRHGFS